MENQIYQLNNHIFWEIEIYRNRNVIKGDSFTADRTTWLDCQRKSLTACHVGDGKSAQDNP